MPVTALPDVLGALLVYLRSVPEITTLVATPGGWTDGRANDPRISGDLSRFWKMPTAAIRMHRSGMPRSNPGLNHWWQRIDIKTYGTTTLNATALMNLVVPALCPDQTKIWSVKHANNIRIYSVDLESGFFTDVEPDAADWHYCLATVVAWYSGVVFP